MSEPLHVAYMHNNMQQHLHSGFSTEAIDFATAPLIFTGINTYQDRVDSFEQAEYNCTNVCKLIQGVIEGVFGICNICSN